MRDLAATRNVAMVKDAVGGTIHELFYRTPTTSERVRFRSQLFERKGNKIINRAFSTQEKFGAIVLEGFKKGSFSVEDKAISSDPGDPDFYDGWKEMIQAAAPELLAVVARIAFDGAEAVTPRQDQPTEIVIEELEDELGE